MGKHFRTSTASASRLISYLTTAAMTACTLPGGVGPGPMVWIDRPLDGGNFPLGPLTIQAHAADSDGITMIEFLVSEGQIGSVATGGKRLEEASLEWTPPAAGAYTIIVHAMDSQGNTNIRAPARVQITVGGATPTPATAQCAVEGLAAPLLLSPADSASLTGEPTLAWAYPDVSCHPYSYAVDISSEASFADISLGFGTLDHNETSRSWPLPAGGCYYWRVKAYVPDVSGPASPVWRFCITDAAATPSSPTFVLGKNAHCREGPGTAYDSVDALPFGTSVAIEGRNEDNSWFRVLRPSGGGRCWISAGVGTASGNLEALPVMNAPPPAATVPAAQTDSTPPEISGLSLSPTLISVATQCGETPPTTILLARVTDPGGLDRVLARISGEGGFEMSPVGNDHYQAVLGPFEEAGTLSIIVQAQDRAGNAATSAPIEVQVLACPG